MMITYEYTIFFCWVIFILVWAFSAFRVKKDIRRSGFSIFWWRYRLLRFVILAGVLFVFIRIATGTARNINPGAIFAHSIFVPSLLLGWISAAITALGLLFAIWARVYLGRNWSPQPAVKERHELVTAGPYAYVRHPIYTGLILMAVGTALTGYIVGIVALLLSCAVYLIRIGTEERIMLELFPHEYPAYQARTKKLIPFVW
jgi:protein-S-isoprenylcysteine O-methyltransferase Ste14